MAKSAIGVAAEPPVLQTTLFLAFVKLRNVGEVARLKYNSDHARAAMPAAVVAKRGQLLVPFYSNSCLFVKERSCSARTDVVCDGCRENEGCDARAALNIMNRPAGIIFQQLGAKDGRL